MYFQSCTVTGIAVLFQSWRCFRLEVTSWKAPLRRAITMFNRIMKRLTSYLQGEERSREGERRRKE
jgi:hypothetical protein